MCECVRRGCSRKASLGCPCSVTPSRLKEGVPLRLRHRRYGSRRDIRRAVPCRLARRRVAILFTSLSGRRLSALVVSRDSHPAEATSGVRRAVSGCASLCVLGRGVPSGRRPTWAACAMRARHRMPLHARKRPQLRAFGCRRIRGMLSRPSHQDGRLEGYVLHCEALLLVVVVVVLFPVVVAGAERLCAGEHRLSR